MLINPKWREIRLIERLLFLQIVYHKPMIGPLHNNQISVLGKCPGFQVVGLVSQCVFRPTQ